MSEPLSILVVDDHAVVRRGTMDIIADMLGEPRFQEAASIAEAEAALERGPVKLMLLDVSLPDGNGLSFLGRLTREHPGMLVVVLSMHHELEYARRALELGAKGYLSKNLAPEELAQAIGAVLAGETYVSPSLKLQCSQASVRPGGLSKREREVAYRLGQGEKLSDIAVAMGIGITTAGTYRSRVMRKLGLKTSADFFRYAIKTDGLF